MADVSRGGRVPLEAVIITDELDRRPSRPPDYALENRTLRHLMQGLAEDPSPRILQRLADDALGLSGAHSAGISLLEEEQGQAVFRWPAVAGRWAAHAGRSMSRASSPCGTVLERNEALLMAWPERHYQYGSDIPLPIAEILLVPIHRAGRPIGVLWGIVHDESRHFDAEDRRRLNALAQFASLAGEVITARLLATESAVAEAVATERANELSATRRLQSLSTHLIQAGDGATLYQQIVEAASLIMQSECASMQLLDPERRGLRLLAHRGFTPEAAAFWQVVHCASHSSCGEALRTGTRVVVPDVEQCEFLAGTDDLLVCRQTGVRAMQSTPLVSRDGRPLGMMSTHWRRPHRPDESALRLFDVLARQAADLIERAQTEQALRDAAVRKDEFLAMLAHELRNPLAPIQSALQLIQTRSDDTTIVEAATAVMQRQVGHLARLVDDLVDVNRITRGKIEVHLERVTLASVVEPAVEAVRPLIERRRQVFMVALPAALVVLNADRTRLAQVLTNLLNNASKFTPLGGRIRLSGEVLSRDTGAGVVLLEVADTGIGIPADQLPRVFDLFVQGDTSLERAQGGLGIGLTLVKAIVELHGGEVEAHSEGPDRGSAFTVHLPLAADAESAASPSPGVRDETLGGASRVLVVDDNRDSADMLALLLRLHGHETQIVYSGQEAVEAAAAFRPAVAVVDIGLPGLSGYDVCRRIRALPGLETVRLVAFTGWGQPEDRQRSRAAGFDVHLVKPVKFRELAELLSPRPGGS